MGKLSFDTFGFRAQNTHILHVYTLNVKIIYWINYRITCIAFSSVFVKNAIKIHGEFQIAYFCTKYLIFLFFYYNVFNNIINKCTKCGHTEKYAKMQHNIQFQKTECAMMDISHPHHRHW